MRGQGIAEGGTLVVPLLQRGDFEIDGPGAALVATLLDRSSTPPRLTMTAKPARGVADTWFTVSFHYGRITEMLSFFVVPASAA
jgi:hypothetical protein